MTGEIHDDRYSCLGPCSECGTLDAAIHGSDGATAALDAILDDLDRTLSRAADTEASAREYLRATAISPWPPSPRTRIWARGLAAAWPAWVDAYLLGEAFALRHHPLLLITAITLITTAVITARRATLADHHAR